LILAIGLAAWMGLARGRWHIVWVVLGAGVAGALARALGLAA
jgi:hypothetical protein